jgi:hypothetical protein
MSNWKLPVTCPVTTPPSCDQIVPTAAGAVNIPPQPFDNRGTFYQAVAVSGHRAVPASQTPAPRMHGRHERRHHRRPARRRASFTG